MVRVFCILNGPFFSSILFNYRTFPTNLFLFKRVFRNGLELYVMLQWFHSCSLYMNHRTCNSLPVIKNPLWHWLNQGVAIDTHPIYLWLYLCLSWYMALIARWSYFFNHSQDLCPRNSEIAQRRDLTRRNKRNGRTSLQCARLNHGEHNSIFRLQIQYMYWLILVR